MGDINWDKLDVSKFGTPESPAYRLLKSIGLAKKRKKAKGMSKQKGKQAKVAAGSASRREAVVGNR